MATTMTSKIPAMIASDALAIMAHHQRTAFDAVTFAAFPLVTTDHVDVRRDDTLLHLHERGLEYRQSEWPYVRVCVHC